MREMEQKFIDKTGCDDADGPVEMLSGRAYLTFTVRNNGKKDKEVPVMLSRCPFCGVKYEAE